MILTSGIELCMFWRLVSDFKIWGSVSCGGTSFGNLTSQFGIQVYGVLFTSTTVYVCIFGSNIGKAIPDSCINSPIVNLGVSSCYDNGNVVWFQKCGLLCSKQKEVHI